MLTTRKTQTFKTSSSDGNETIARAVDVFDGDIDPEFLHAKLNIPGKSMKSRQIQFHPVGVRGKLGEIFLGISANLNDLCLEQSEVCSIVRKHKTLLAECGCQYFILIKSGVDFFAVRASFHRHHDAEVDFGIVKKLTVSPISIQEDARVWDPSDRYKIITPLIKRRASLKS